MENREIIRGITGEKRGAGGIKNVYYVACGGSFAGFYPCIYFLEHESRTLHFSAYTSNEFYHAPPAALGENSLVIACSMRGTPETGNAVELAKKRGAATVSYYIQESHMTEVSDYSIPYRSLMDKETPANETNASMALEFTMELLRELEGFKNYEKMKKGFSDIPFIYNRAVEYCKPLAEEFARRYRHDKVVYVLGGGPSMGAAYIFSICNLMEMQQLHSPTVNTGELLHGPFESLDDGVPVFMLLSAGRTRPVDERALRFVNTYARRHTVLDALDLGLDKIDGEVAEYFNHILFCGLLNNCFLPELSRLTGIPYTQRRYMWKVQY